MIKKFKDAPESKLFVTGCTHFNHDPKWDVPLWKMRGYDSAHEMTEGIIRTINETCRQSDHLLVLGDFCLNTTIEEFWNIVNRLNPHLLFVNGNHDNPWRKAYEQFCMDEFGHIAIHLEHWGGKISYYGDYLQLNWNKRPFVCNHFPYLVFDGMARNTYSLCSHSHGSCQWTLPNDYRMKQLDCGWDVHKKPLDFQEIMRIMDKKTREFLPDHHDKNTNGGF
jgi:calcineurin-like phosphoesterase family protein